MTGKRRLLANTNGYWTCRIPGIAVTKSDVVLVTTEARPGRGGDYDFNDVLMRRSTDGGNLAHDRKRLTVKLSRDDGRTWPVSKTLEPGPAGYSDLAVLFDGTILCLYEADIVTRMCDDRYVRLARFNLQWLTGAEAAPEHSPTK